MYEIKWTSTIVVYVSSNMYIMFFSTVIFILGTIESVPVYHRFEMSIFRWLTKDGHVITLITIKNVIMLILGILLFIFWRFVFNK